MVSINEKIQELNNRGIPIIFIVCGNNSAGKTTFTKKLIQSYDFYQSVNLGILSKMIRFFRPDIKSSELENFDGNEASLIFKNLVGFIIESYTKTGVNVIVEGVQIDTEGMVDNKAVIGGIILDIEPKLAAKKGDKPETHFNRSIQKNHLKKIHYVPSSKFKKIKNNDTIEQVFNEIVLHLDHLLDKKLKTI